MKRTYLPIARLLALALAPLALSTSASAQSHLAGTYVYLQQTATITELPVLKDVQATTRAVVVLQLDQQGNQLQGKGELCSLQVDSTSKMVKTSFPAAFLAALPPTSLELALDGKGGIKSNKDTLVLGARLKNPSSDPLPKNAKDARVFDQDGDGHPGMTVRVDGFVSGDVYVVQRTITELRGTHASETMEGQVRFNVDQQVVGASSAVLKGGPQPTPDLSRSFFRLQRVSEAVTCEEAKKLASAWRK